MKFTPPATRVHSPRRARCSLSRIALLSAMLGVLGALDVGSSVGQAQAAQDVAQSSPATKEAIADYDAGNYPVARSEFKAQAEQGDRLAEFNYAMMMLNGEGGPADLETAKVWLKRSAEAGMAHAQYAYGRLFDDGTEVQRDAAEAHRWYLLAAAQGHVLAEVALANQFFIGRGAPRDDAQAFHWYKLAAQAGDLTSQYVVGSYYEFGRGGVAKNLNIARFWYAEAGAQGDPAGLGKFKELSQELAREHSQGQQNGNPGAAPAESEKPL